MASRIELDVLNCGAGDISLVFNANDPMEVERAKRIVQDMLRRGYALFVTGTDGKLTKVNAFDEKLGVYLIADGPDGSAPEFISQPIGKPACVDRNLETPLESASSLGGTGEIPDKTSDPGAGTLSKQKRGRPVKMSHAKVTAVGRSAGG